MSLCTVMYLEHQLHMFLGLMSAQTRNGSVKHGLYLMSRQATLESTNVKQVTPMEMPLKRLLYFFQVSVSCSFGRSLILKDYTLQLNCKVRFWSQLCACTLLLLLLFILIYCNNITLDTKKKAYSTYNLTIPTKLTILTLFTIC